MRKEAKIISKFTRNDKKKDKILNYRHTNLNTSKAKGIRPFGARNCTLNILLYRYFPLDFVNSRQ